MDDKDHESLVTQPRRGRLATDKQTPATTQPGSSDRRVAPILLVVLVMVVLVFSCIFVLLTITSGRGAGPGPSVTEESSGQGAGGSDQQNSVLVVRNGGNEPICQVYVSTTEDQNWGANWLGVDEVIVPGGNKHIALPPGIYDAQVRDCNNAILDELSDLAVSINEEVTWEAGAPPSSASAAVRLVNHAGVEICYVYISLSSSDSWGDDWLSVNETIPADLDKLFEVEPGTYDLQAVDCMDNVLSEEKSYRIAPKVVAVWEVR